MAETRLPATSPPILGPYYPLGRPSKGATSRVSRGMAPDAKRIEFNIVLMNG